MATISGATVTLQSTGGAVRADCFGNNAAVLCPGCSGPILLIARPNQRGSDAQHPVPCPACTRATFIATQFDPPNQLQAFVIT